ncbi:M56 family metallopeptidase [Nonomuraea sp. NPDC050680]|uniref:M56 family metallopeptidase n=1 Tax=Nonomuraea sp. NPDC050680 TaxID=3154630 RepID=UPI0033CD6A0A
MNTAVALAAYAVMLAAVGPSLLRRVSWAERAPRLAIAAWQSLTVAVIGAAMLAGLTVVVPASAFGAGLAQALNACVMMLRDSYATPQGALVVTAALVASIAITARLMYSLGAELMFAWWERHRHLTVLQMVARRDARLGVLVVDHDAALAYCLPGRGGPIVLTTSALAALDDRQLAAVLAHERAHLRGRHHLLTATARGLRRAFPFIALFATAEQEIDRLAELAADDAAVQASDRLTVADALLTLASDQRTPAPALAAATHHTGQRVRRLLAHSPPLRTTATLAIGILARAAMAAPLVIAAVPAVVAIGMNCCFMR